MRIVKFEGASMREALANVKAELGDQAVVVSTRQIKKGLLGSAYEIAAAIEDDQPPPALRVPNFAAAGAARPRPGAPTAGHPDDQVERAVAPLRAELRSLRAMMRAKTDERPSNDLRGELASLRRALDELRGRPGHAAPAAAPITAGSIPAAAAAAAAAAASAPAANAPTPLAAPSVANTVLLVGATGVGKTTTIAKIAAQAALIDHRRVALVTLDNYRVGGIEQIRTFADLIGVPLYVVEDPAHLGAQLDELADYELTLVDTAGRSPRDRSAIATLERALGGTRGVEVHLTASASTTPAQLDELHDRFAPLRPRRLLFTKLDEVVRAPDLVAAPTRLRLPITWLATGQAVPEDLELATSPRLAELAKHGLTLTDRSVAA